MSKRTRTIALIVLVVLCLMGATLYSLRGPLGLRRSAASPLALQPHRDEQPEQQTSRRLTPAPTASASLLSPALPGLTYLGFTAHIFSQGGNSLVYYLYVPQPLNPQRRYPLVLLLHGGGERSRPTYTATQNEQLLLNQSYVRVWSSDYQGPANPHIQERWPCFVLVPQMKQGQQWVNVPINGGSYHQPAQPSIPLQLTKALLERVLQAYSNNIDRTRLYVTGLSNGGYGTWDAIERWPDLFAAAAPIAGAGDPSLAARIKELPIWAFHGSADPVVPVSGSREMIAALRAVGGHPRYTEFAGAGHGVWGYVYSLENSPLRVSDFFPWLFAQHR
ncbi:prolyl oligopeptidase family serine peptidase [Thermogemmatispora sp.]|uniref:carboxylesterase family protein n=1 Tax=Thermogemmatispora sp. TaxID=1968838 RepID=UPI0035E45B1C